PAHISLLIRGETRFEEEAGQAEDAVQRRAELVADGREQPRLRLICRFGLAARLALLAFAELPGRVGERFKLCTQALVLGHETVAIRGEPAKVDPGRRKETEREKEEEHRNEDRRPHR